MRNICVIKKNRFYEEIYDLIDEEELKMDNIEHGNRIKGILKKYIEKFEKSRVRYVEIGDKRIEEVIVENIIDEVEYKTQGNTLLCQIYEKYMYEVVYSENLDNKIIKRDEDMNDVASICNIEMYPIYNNVVIIKTEYGDGDIRNVEISRKDIEELIINNFYYMGVLVDENKMTEIEFTGENINRVIGASFEKHEVYELFELTFVIYEEKREKRNEMLSNIFEREIKNRAFICLLCPISKKKYMRMTINILKNIINIKSNDEKMRRLLKELDGKDKLINPMIYIEKNK
jgi:hypothetical protein